VVESFQVKPDMIKTIGGSGRVVEVRDEYMPVIDLEKVFEVPRFDFEHVSNIMVVVEAEGGRVALLVDELLGQQQVVVKNLEANYRKVRRVGRHHHGRRPCGPDPGRGLPGAASHQHPLDAAVVGLGHVLRHPVLAQDLRAISMTM
jgi:hypothetical protein